MMKTLFASFYLSHSGIKASRVFIVNTDSYIERYLVVRR